MVPGLAAMFCTFPALRKTYRPTPLANLRIQAELAIMLFRLTQRGGDDVKSIKVKYKRKSDNKRDIFGRAREE